MLWRNLRLLSVTLLLTGMFSMARDASAAGTKWAVLVGVDHYRDQHVSSLKYAVADVKAVSKDLVEYDGFPANQVFTLTSDVQDQDDPNYPSNNHVFDRLATLARHINPEDTFLFYFSGHGFQKGEGSEFLSTINADPTTLDSLQVTTIPLQTLRNQMKSIQARKVIFIIDACRNDPESGRGDAPNKQTAAFTKDLQTVVNASAGGAAGTAVLFACSEGQRSWEWPEMGHGAFTYYLMQGLEGKAAQPGGEVTMDGLGKYVQKQVQGWAQAHNAQQTPDLEQQGTAAIVLGHIIPGGGNGDGNAQPVDTIAQINISTQPAGAEVFVDGVDQRMITPCNLDVDLDIARTRDVEIGVKLEGYQVRKQKVTLRRAQSVVVNWSLQRSPQPLTPRVRPGSTVRINPRDGAEMVYVPAGPFAMGSNDGNDDEKPQRQVMLGGYWIYKDLVTVAQYGRFCDATGHPMPPAPYWGWHGNHPMVNLTWADAKAYCDWAGVELPTEAQWEKAARGTDGRTYPWGNYRDPSLLQCSKAGDGDARGTTPVGSFPKGASPYGCLDMAGNVRQWCADWYDPNYYQAGPLSDPPGPATGNQRLLLGGGFFAHLPTDFRCSERFKWNPTSGNNDFGVRGVVRDEPPPVIPPPSKVDRKVNPKDGAEMVYIPAGPFIMGEDPFPDRKPQHRVTLDAYYMYKTPVTVAQYQKFCDATGHAMPPVPAKGWNGDRPIEGVSFDDAKAYCDWAGVDLPTEAEWEKAARGTDGRIYPWGNEWDPSKLRSSKAAIGDAGSTAPVGSFPTGASPYGCLDMAGSLWQWCTDWYDENYYQNAPSTNPTGPETGTVRALRGGSWANIDQDFFRCSRRNPGPPGGSLLNGYNVWRDIGFRCVAPARP